MMNDKYYLFEEWHHYDGGGMHMYTFNTNTDVEEYLTNHYPPGDLKQKFETGQLVIVYGNQVFPVVEEIEVIKKIRL